MKEKLLLLSNLCLFTFTALFLATAQTSLWYQVFGYFPGPALWIPCLVYIALQRSTVETLVFSYLVGFVLSTLTTMNEGVLITVCMALSLSTQVFKQRIFWPGSSYFMMTCGFAALVFHIYHWLAALIFEGYAITNPQISDWLIEALLTPLAAPLLDPLFHWFDKMTKREQPNEI